MRGSKPLIGIPARALNDNVDPWLPKRQGLFNSYVDAVIAAGGLPLMMPLSSDEEALKAYFALCDGLLFAGGGDITPHFYGQETKVSLQRNNPQQDKNELILASWAILEQKPILGICRGMQLLNVAMGGTLCQDLVAAGITERDHNESEVHQDFTLPVHSIRIDGESGLAQAVEATEFQVNSLHHQGIGELAADLEAVAWAEDGVIEAAEGTQHPYLILTQFHPELLAAERDPRWMRLFEDFVEVSHRDVISLRR